MKNKIYTLKDKDELILTGKQLKEWRFHIEKNMMKRIKSWMGKGHDDFCEDYCISIERWDKIWCGLGLSFIKN